MTIKKTTAPLTHWEKYGGVYKQGALFLGLALLGAAAKAYSEEGASRGGQKSGDSGGDSWQTADGAWFDSPSEAAEYHQDVYGKR